MVVTGYYSNHYIGVKIKKTRRCNQLVKLLVLFMLVISLMLVTVPIAGADSGGPDSYGYTYEDSDEPGGPTYNWVEISGTGSTGPGFDDSYVTAWVGFDFSLYGNTSNVIVISSNGYLTFPYSGFVGGEHNGGNCIPSSLIYYPDLFIAPFWDDLDPEYIGGTIYYETRGTAPNRQFIVEWDGIYQCCAGQQSSVTFEAILYEGSSDILFQYQDVVFGGDYAHKDYGADATVGIENADGTNGLQYSCNSPALNSGLAILFTTNGNGLRPVGGEAYSVKTVGLTTPLIGLAIAVVAGIFMIRLRKAR